jgi:hypothetical protein
MPTALAGSPAVARRRRYISDRIERGTPAEQAAADCGQYARYLHLTGAADWRDRLRALLWLE